MSANDFTPESAAYLECICGKSYKHMSSLCKHKKICCDVNQYNNLVKDSNENFEQGDINEQNMSDKEIIKMLIKENSEFKNLILEIVKKDTQSINTSNNTNCNNVNNSFNLNLFLNEKCKDAINISDFVDIIKLQLTDLETTGRVGYVDGVSKILIKNLNELDTYSRPIHCSDLKREVLYIKDNDQWTKESDDKPVLKNMIKQVANKNIKQIQAWKDNNPGCCNSDSKKNNQYLNIVMNSMSGGSNEEQTTNISQIMKNVDINVLVQRMKKKQLFFLKKKKEQNLPSLIKLLMSIQV
jgi:hypothetical protein